MSTFYTFITGVLSGGWDFFSKWRDQKAKQAEIKLSTEQRIVETTQQIKYEQATSDVKNTAARIAQMAKSWKDEFIMFVFYAPFITNVASPFVDLYFALKDQAYQQGMLAEASLTSISSFNEFPTWYVLIVILIALWSWGADKDTIDKFINLLTSIIPWNKK